MSDTQTIAPPRPVMTVDTMIQNYLRLRDRKKEIESRHKAELAQYKITMDQLEGWLLEAMHQTGLDSMKSPHGTAFKTTRTSASVRDWTATLAYIRANDAWQLLEARVSKLAVQDLIKDTQKPVPGVETSSEVCVNVRKAGEQPTGK
jgi:hypothetical protein